MQDAMLERKTIRAPFTGVVGLRQVNLGQYVTPGHRAPKHSVFRSNLFKLHITRAFSQRSRARSASHRAEVDAFAGQEFKGEIRAIEPSVRESTRTIQVQAQFANPEHSPASRYVCARSH